ncbi:GTPase Era [Turicibacter sanguinis]|nr:GTPase Era [Turicibacter sanguinis]
MNKEMIQKILNELKEISHDSEPEYLDEIVDLEHMLDQDVFKIAVMGEFSVGKSTFLNALIGKRILYASANEATAVVTAIMNSQDKVAKVYLKNQSIVEIDLEKDGYYEELESYLSIDSDANVEQVVIEYPFKEMDKGIILLDTPGLKGISEKQLEITKQAINTANATILLINEKGISQSELDLLTGSNESFGKIKTKEIIIVINKIGEIIQKRGLDEGGRKVDEVKQSVLKELEKNNLSHIKVFELDSRDCLWGRDEALYEQVKQSSLSKFSTILSQYDYFKQSRFEAFENFLYSFFSSDHKEKMLLEEISYRSSLIAEELRVLLNEENTSSYGSLDKELKILENKKHLVLANRRRLYNTMVRQLDELTQIMNGLIQDYVQTNEQVLHQRMLHCVDRMIQTLEDVKTHKTDALFDKLSELLTPQVKDYEVKINEFYQSVQNILAQAFNQEFSRLFEQPAQLNLNLNKLELEFKVGVEPSSFEEENALKIIDEEIGCLKEQVYQDNQQLECLIAMNLKQQCQQLRDEQERFKRQFEQRKKALGKRPEPVQKYKKIIKTKGIWIFKKTYTEEVPNGLDYSPCKRWDKEMQKEIQAYHIQKNELSEQLMLLHNKELQRDALRKQIDELNEQLVQLEQIRYKQFQLLQKQQKVRQRQILDDKKYEIHYWLMGILKRYHKSYISKLSQMMDDLNLDIKREIEIVSNRFIDEYQSQLEDKIRVIYSDLEKQKTSQEKSITKIDEIIKLLG